MRRSGRFRGRPRPWRGTTIVSRVASTNLISAGDAESTRFPGGTPAPSTTIHFVPLPHLVLPTQVPFVGEGYGWGRLVSGRPCAVSTAYLQSRADWEAVWGSSTRRHGVQGTRARFFPTVHR